MSEDKFKTIKAGIGKIEKRLVDGLQLIFKPITIDPKTSIEEIMYNAGQVSVLQYLQRLLEENK